VFFLLGSCLIRGRLDGLEMGWEINLGLRHVEKLLGSINSIDAFHPMSQKSLRFLRKQTTRRVVSKNYVVC